MQAFFCGVDLGTTNLKVLLCDMRGRVVALRACPTPRVPDGAAVLTDPARVLAAVEGLLDAVWNDVGRRGRIAAIATAGTGEDGFLIDGALKPRGLSIPWFDRRAEAEAAELALACQVRDHSGIAFDATRTAAKWLWLARNSPARGADDLWITLTDWPLVAWTGQPVMTEALAARTACWDIHRHSWLVEALAAAGAPALPEVQPGGSVIGTLSADSFPVRIGAADTRTVAVLAGHDHPVAAAPIRQAHPGAIVDSLGTAELVHAESATPLRDLDGLVRCIPAAPGMVDACLHVFELETALSAIPGERLRAELMSGAGYAGLSEDLRLVLEAATADLDETLRRMFRAGVADGGLFTTGGRARSDAFMQLRADRLNRSVTRVEEAELCGLGAAIVAASALGQTIVPELAVTRFLPSA